MSASAAGAAAGPSTSSPSAVPAAPAAATPPAAPAAAPAGPVSSASASPPAAPARPELPWAFIHCPTDTLVVLIAHMLELLCQHNDQVVLTPDALTRFHSRAPPGISVVDYLRRVVKYTSLEKTPLLSLLAYIDLTCQNLPTFTLSSLTVHRFLIAGVTAGSKAQCDVFCTNGHYAKVGGIKVQELNSLEREFLRVTQWALCCNADLLQRYYSSLIRSHGGYTQAPEPAVTPFRPFPRSMSKPPSPVVDYEMADASGGVAGVEPDDEASEASEASGAGEASESGEPGEPDEGEGVADGGWAVRGSEAEYGDAARPHLAAGIDQPRDPAVSDALAAHDGMAVDAVAGPAGPAEPTDSPRGRARHRPTGSMDVDAAGERDPSAAAGPSTPAFSIRTSSTTDSPLIGKTPAGASAGSAASPRAARRPPSLGSPRIAASASASRLARDSPRLSALGAGGAAVAGSSKAVPAASAASTAPAGDDDKDMDDGAGADAGGQGGAPGANGHPTAGRLLKSLGGIFKRHTQTRPDQGALPPVPPTPLVSSAAAAAAAPTDVPLPTSPRPSEAVPITPRVRTRDERSVESLRAGAGAAAAGGRERERASGLGVGLGRGGGAAQVGAGERRGYVAVEDAR